MKPQIGQRIKVARYTTPRVRRGKMSVPSIAPVGADADEIPRFVREKSYAELDTLRFQLAGLSEDPSRPLNCTTTGASHD
jgi:hypothetical protein